MYKVGSCCLVGFLIGFHSLASAERNLQTNGFITAAFTQTDSEVPFAGVQDEINFSQSSLIGVQTIFTPSDASAQFVIQLLAEGVDGWDVGAEWAFFKYTLNDNVEFQLGKVRVPLTIISESIHVGLTYPWSRPPDEVFFIPFTSSDGLRVKGNLPFLGGELEPQLLIAEGSGLSLAVFGEILDIADVKIYATILGWQSDHVNIRAAVFRMTDLAIAGTNSLRANLGNAQAIATLLGLGIDIITAPPSEEVEIENLSLAYHDGPIRLIAEVSSFTIVDSILLPPTDSGFFNVGYRIGKLTPHVTYSFSDAKKIAAVDRSQKSLALGLQFAASPSTVVKFDVIRSKLDDGPLVTGSYDSVHPSLGSGVVIDDKVVTMNASVSMVF